jgi:hypothetical protein
MAAVAVVGVGAMLYGLRLSGLQSLRIVEQWAAGKSVDRESALAATYTWARGAVSRWVPMMCVGAALLLIAFGAVAGATGSRLFQYGIVGAFAGLAVVMIGVHPLVEAAMRPARLAIVGETSVGDLLPRSRPTFAAWSNICVLSTAFGFAVVAALLAVASSSQASANPAICVVIAAGLTLFIALPITVSSDCWDR